MCSTGGASGAACTPRRRRRRSVSSSRCASPSGGLVLLAEVAAAGLVAVQRVDAHQLGRTRGSRPRGRPSPAPGSARRRRRGPSTSRPELLAQLADPARAPCVSPASLRAMPQWSHMSVPELAVEGVDGAVAVDRRAAASIRSRDRASARLNAGVVGVDRRDGVVRRGSRRSCTGSTK